MHSFTEENYLKVIYHLSQRMPGPVQTNAIAGGMQTRAASVTDMLKKLAEKKLIDYVRYQGVTLTAQGQAAAIGLVRKHRLWEVFLVEKLKFRWDEVHDIAEELEHVSSPLLTERLDDFLGNPVRDPHGDPIPDKSGHIEVQQKIHLHELRQADQGLITGVSEYKPAFLRQLEKLGLTIGAAFEILAVAEYDGTVELKLNGSILHISREMARHILISHQSAED